MTVEQFQAILEYLNHQWWFWTLLFIWIFK